MFSLINHWNIQSIKCQKLLKKSMWRPHIGCFVWYLVYSHIKQRKAANPRISEAQSRARVAFLLDKWLNYLNYQKMNVDLYSGDHLKDLSSNRFSTSKHIFMYLSIRNSMCVCLGMYVSVCTSLHMYAFMCHVHVLNQWWWWWGVTLTHWFMNWCIWSSV